MIIITGDDNGLLKCSEVKISEASKQVFKYGLQKEDHEIHNLTWSLKESSDYWSFTHSNGIVKTFDMNDQKVFIKKQLDKSDKSTIKGISPIGDDITCQTLLYAESNGNVKTIKLDADNIEEQKSEELFKIVKRADKNKITTMAHRENSQYLFLGEFLPQIYDIETKKLIWKGKNVSNDENDLEVPLYDTSGQFLPNSTREFIISNGHGKVRLYDVLSKPRPSIDIQVWDYMLTKIRPTDCGKYVLFSSQKGELFKSDIRMNFRLVHKLKGSKGTIRDIGVASNIVACIGLDRYLRIYDHNTQESLSNIYLKQKLNTLLIDNSTVNQFTDALEEKRRKEEEQDEIDHELFWNSTGGRKRRRNNNDYQEKAKYFKFKD